MPEPCPFAENDLVQWSRKTSSTKLEPMKVVAVCYVLGNLQRPDYYWQNYWKISALSGTTSAVLSAPAWLFELAQAS